MLDIDIKDKQGEIKQQEGHMPRMQLTRIQSLAPQIASCATPEIISVCKAMCNL